MHNFLVSTIIQWWWMCLHYSYFKGNYAGKRNCTKENIVESTKESFYNTSDLRKTICVQEILVVL